MSNTTCTTQTFLELSLKPLLFRCWNKDFYHQATSHMILQNWEKGQPLIFINDNLSLDIFIYYFIQQVTSYDQINLECLYLKTLYVFLSKQ